MDITFSYKAFDVPTQEAESALEASCRRKLESVLTVLETRYPEDMGFSVWVCSGGSKICLNAYTCDEHTHFDICSTLTFMPARLLTELLDSAMSSAAHEDDEDPGILPPECLAWIHNHVWQYARRGEFEFGGIGKMEPGLVEAFRNLKETGLLDGMPEGAIYVREPYDANVLKRRVWIPECLDDLHLSDASSVPEIMKTLYKRCFLDHIVDHAVYGEGIDAPTEALEQEMMEYAEAVADGE